MPAIRYLTAAGLLLAGLLAAVGVRAAGAPDGLESTRQLAQGGAVQLAMHRIGILQPADRSAQSWADWERLRLQLLAGAGRNEELLQRIAAWPDAKSAGPGPEMHAAAAGAALVLGRYAAVRDHAGRALWVADAGAAGIRSMRLLVIRSYARESNAADAYRSMLRFQQDYRPLDRETATEFVDLLLDLGLAREAVNWLGLLEERGAAKLRLRLHTGLVTPRDAETQARTALARNDDPRWWRVILDAATRQQAGVLAVEAQERLLNYKDAPAATASGLWEVYAGYARQNANAHQLLAGDEANWLEFALRNRDAQPAAARAYLGYLAHHANGEALRRRAQEELAAGYAAAGLSRTALRAFDAWPGNAAMLTVSTRHILGGLADKLGDPVQASDYWNGLPAPIDTPLLNWELRLSALALRAGRAGSATDTVKKLTEGRPPIPPALLPEWLALARQFSDYGLHQGALLLYESALPHSDNAQARIVLSGIAAVHELRNQPMLAADYHLRSALRAVVPDAGAADSRLRAGLALVRAGLRDDARAQFEWLLQHAKDPEQLTIARRELGR